MDADEKPPQPFMTALTTEHFVLQGARSTLTAESAGRAALYLASLTGSLIALGFVTRDATVLGPFAVAVLPALLILGEFTYWRLVNAGVEDFHYRWEIQRIRAYYRGLVPPGLMFFSDAAVQNSTTPVRQFMGVRARDLNVFLTVASMVAAINSILAGDRGGALPCSHENRHPPVPGGTGRPELACRSGGCFTLALLAE